MRRCCELLPFLVGGRPECAHQVEVLQSSDVSALTTSPPVSCPSLQNTARLLNDISLPSFVSSWRPEEIWCAKRRSSTSVGSSTSVEILSLQLAFLLLWRCLSKTLWGFDQENSLSMTMVLSLFDSSRCSRSLTRCLPASGYLCSFGLAVAPSSHCSTPLMVVMSTCIAPRGAASAPQASLLLLEPRPFVRRLHIRPCDILGRSLSGMTLHPFHDWVIDDKMRSGTFLQVDTSIPDSLGCV